MSTLNIIELKEKVKLFREKFLHGTVKNFTNKDGVEIINWSVQHLPDEPHPKTGRRDIAFWPTKPLRELRDDDLVNHFLGRPINVRGSKKGSVGVTGKFEGNIAKWFVLDCDKPVAVEAAHEKIIPVLKGYAVDYIWEHSGSTEGEKGHLWFMCNMPIETLKAFVLQVFHEAGLSHADRKIPFELYPVIKDSNVIRLPGGYHLRNKKVNPITYKGVTSNDVNFILDTFINAKQLLEEDIKESIKIPTKKKDSDSYSQSRRFYFHSRNLPLPVSNLPPLVGKLASNCQAINQILTECVNDDLLNDTSGLGHDAGLFLTNLAIYNDFRSVSGNKRVHDGENWIEDFINTYRDRDYDSHGWEKSWKKAKEEGPERIFPSCQRWEDRFDMCQGCPFKGRKNFSSPRQLWGGYNVLKQKVGDVKLVSPVQIRQDTFKRIKNRVHQLVDNKWQKDILVASPQGSGKSWLVDELAVELAKKGKKVLIAAPTADLAMQHKRWCKQNGEDPFVVMSHEKLFDKLNPGFDCPKAGEIKHLYDLGVSSGTWKKNFCKKCPFYDDCPYPRQYSNVIDGDHKIVIIQHAHFTCKETLFSIMQKQYDVMFIDEAFIDNTHIIMKPTELEWTILDGFRDDIPWAGPLSDWLKNGLYPPDKKVYRPQETHLELIREKMDHHNCKYRVPEFLRYYNLQSYIDRTSGLHVFYPLPEVPVRIFTDATPPIEYLKIVLDNQNIETFGEDEVLDYRYYNKENQVIQVLDNSMSKSSLKGSYDDVTGEFGFERFVEILEFFGELAKKNPDEKFLLTTYADGKRDNFTTVALDWLKMNYPDMDLGTTPPHRVCVSHMMIGTNMWEEYTTQVLVAGVYRSGQQLSKEVFDLRSIANFWNRLRERQEISNPFPHGVGEGASIERVDDSVKRILCLGSNAGIYSYPNFIYRRPLVNEFDIIERYAIAKTQQAIRLRFNDARKRVVYIFGNYFLPSFLITDSVLEDDLLGSIRRK